MLSLRKLAINSPNHLWLKLPVNLKEKAWEQSQNHSNATARSNAYVNYLCLNTFVPWLEAWLEEEQLREESSTEQAINPSVFQDQYLSSLWEVLSGMAIDIGETRLVLIPSETTDIEEFCVPQEWVDIPSWKADYYLPVQVNLTNKDNSWMRLWGYITHQQLKSKGVYDESDRSYYISQEHLDEDWKRMLSELKPVLTRKAEEGLELELHPEVAKELLEKLGDSSLYSPRLAVQFEHRFEQWEALLVNHKWREELYLRRIGQWSPLPPLSQWSPLPPLSQWFNVNDIKVIEALKTAVWQLYRGGVDTPQATAFATRSRTDKSISWVKRIDSVIPTNYPTVLAITLTKQANQTILILPQVRPLGSVNRKTCIPEGLKLILLDESGKIVKQVQAGRSINQLQLKSPFNNELGTRFSIKIALGVTNLTENFII